MFKMRVILASMPVLILVGYGGAPALAAASSSNRASHIAELRNDLVNIPASQPAVDPMAALDTWFIAPSPYWNKTNPAWPAVFARVKEDIAPELLVAFEKNRSHAYAFWNATLATHLSDAEIDQLLRYFRSEQGKRYIDFQRTLDDIAQHSDPPSLFGGSNFEFPAGDPPSDDTIKERIRILGLSLSRFMASQQSATQQPAELNKLDESLELESLSEIAIARGSDLDRLSKENRSDLDAFEKFNHSNLMRKMVAGAIADMKQDAIRERNKSSSDEAAAISRHLSIWQADFGPMIASACAAAQARIEAEVDKPPTPDRPDLGAWQKTVAVAQAAANDLLRASRRAEVE